MNADQYLDRGERLLWAANPDPMRYAVSKALGMAVSGLFFFGFAVFWVFMARDLPSEFWLFGLIFIAIGLCLLLSPAFFYWRAPRVAYVLTDKRAVIDIQGPFSKRISVPLDQVPFVTLKGVSNGIGSVLFIETTYRARRGRTNTIQDGFMAITEPEKVERLMRDAISTLREVA
jgi:hypothetical protein